MYIISLIITETESNDLNFIKFLFHMLLWITNKKSIMYIYIILPYNTQVYYTARTFFVHHSFCVHYKVKENHEVEHWSKNFLVFLKKRSLVSCRKKKVHKLIINPLFFCLFVISIYLIRVIVIYHKTHTTFKQKSHFSQTRVRFFWTKT